MAKNARGVFEKVKGSGEWWICYYDADGRRRREKAGTKATAIKLYIKRKQQALEGVKLPESLKTRKITFGELMDAAIEYTKQNTPEGAEKRYKCRMTLVREAFGAVPADSITPEDLSRWLTDQRRKNEWRPATANRYKAFFSLCFRLGMQNGRCKSNPARLVKRLPEENERTRFLSEEEEERLRQLIERDCPEHLPELDIALHCGMRQGEQYNLLWPDVDLDGPRAKLRKTKNKSTRYAPLNAVAREALHQLLENAQKDQQNLFMSKRGMPLKKPRYWWDRVIKEAGIEDFRWHDLRHTFASRLVMAGVDLRTVAQLLGHKTLQMVMRYAHLSQSHELGAVERLCNTGQVNEKPTATRTATSTKKRLKEVA